MIKVVGDRFLIKVKSHQEKSDGGILIPSSVKEEFSEGEVVGIGERVSIEGVKIGDNVLYTRNTGSEQIIDGEAYMVVCEDDIELVFEKD
jgi:chaperonin GroES